MLLSAADLVSLAGPSIQVRVGYGTPHGNPAGIFVNVALEDVVDWLGREGPALLPTSLFSVWLKQSTPVRFSEGLGIDQDESPKMPCGVLNELGSTNQY